VPLETSVCSCCQTKLRSVELDKTELDMLQDQTEKLAPVQVPLKNKQWNEFMAWIDKTLASQPAPDAVIDGANIAYFKGGYELAVPAKSSKDPSTFNPQYEQIDAVYELLKSKVWILSCFFYAVRKRAG